jgi:hypothetical protein
MRWQLVPLLMITACGGGGGGGGPYFVEAMFFNEDVRTAPVSPHSENWLAGLRAAGGWGAGDRMLVDFDISVLHAGASTPRRTFQPDTTYFYEPDCDHVEMPVPTTGRLEGETGYECRNNGDCHLIVYDDAAGKLYEMWKANMVDASFYGGCLAVWDTRKAYGGALRGEQCSSADGAGFPIAPLLFTADEVAAGEIAHAIRFVLPNDRIQRAYVRPATHATETTGPVNAPPYGVHLRLKPGYPVDSLPTEGARVVARALQTYGMYHADGGEYALTAEADTYSAAKWEGLLGPADLAALQVEDFEVIDHGEPRALTFHCAR